ncbi:hypothetical protein EV421DRAFT_1708953 [Armillaria borealis]|uniref:Uncharacterized protein n=1 Tax=Armillaria borealis TaxID=47425 RepID=A0AA39MSY2_9AGAR|nr:hypothetical protein EV421DRAFT_1708953 [Armillaria borealis]
MCFTLHVADVYACTHQVVTKRQRVDCNNRLCRYSSMHLWEQHNCIATCAQTYASAPGSMYNADLKARM